MPVVTSLTRRRPDSTLVLTRPAPFLLLLLLLGAGSSWGQQAGRRQKNSEECAIFKSNDTVALSYGTSSYIEIGDVFVHDVFSISMQVFPSPLNHNGILFSVGSKKTFEYYEWKDAAIHTQFIVLEFIFSALALTVKALGTEHLRQIEVYKTWPKPYRIDDAAWHTVSAHREGGDWRLSLDKLTVTSAINNKTDVQLLGKPAYIGGRPDYTNHQFQGIIRNLKINGKPMSLSGKKTSEERSGPDSLVQVWHCGAQAVQNFIYWMQKSREHKR